MPNPLHTTFTAGPPQGPPHPQQQTTRITLTETLRTRIIELLSRDLDNFYSISDIAKKLGVAYSHAHLFVKKLVDEKVIGIQKIGNVSVCKLNLSEQITLGYLTLIEYRRTAEWKKKNSHSDKVLEKIEMVKDSVHCILLKGNKKIIVVPEGMGKPDMGVFRNRTVINRTQLNVNKKYYRDAIILHGAEKYWSLIE